MLPVQRFSRKTGLTESPAAYNAQWFVSAIAAAINPPAMMMAACWFMVDPLRLSGRAQPSRERDGRRLHPNFDEHPLKVYGLGKEGSRITRASKYRTSEPTSFRRGAS
jgi:hypothetical protein